MRELYALGPGGRTRGVVDRARRVLVRVPTVRAAAAADRREEAGVGDAVDDDPLTGHHLPECFVVLRVDEEDLCARVVDHVLDLGRSKPEIDRHEHAPRAADAEEGDQETSRVRAHDGDPPADGHVEVVERGGEAE